MTGDRAEDGEARQALPVLTALEAALAEEVRVLRAPWQEPLELSVEISPPDSAVLVLDGTEDRFTGRGVPDVLDAVTGFLRERIVDPDLRPVVGKDPVLLTPRRLGASLGTGPPHYLTATPCRPRRRARARRGRTACGRR